MASQETVDEVLLQIAETYRIYLTERVRQSWEDVMHVFEDVVLWDALTMMSKASNIDGNYNKPTPNQYFSFCTYAKKGQETPKEFSTKRTISSADHAKRCKDLSRLFTGKIKHPLNSKEQRLILKSEISGDDPVVIELRNKQRAALGWPLVGG